MLASSAAECKMETHNSQSMDIDQPSGIRSQEFEDITSSMRDQLDMILGLNEEQQRKYKPCLANLRHLWKLFDATLHRLLSMEKPPPKIPNQWNSKQFLSYHTAITDFLNVVYTIYTQFNCEDEMHARVCKKLESVKSSVIGLNNVLVNEQWVEQFTEYYPSTPPVVYEELVDLIDNIIRDMKPNMERHEVRMIYLRHCKEYNEPVRKTFGISKTQNTVCACLIPKMNF